MHGLVLAVAYLCGSVPFGLVLARAVAGKDVRTEGSGNIGATNVARVVGKKLGAVVLVLDALKGALPVIAAQHLFPGEPLFHDAVGVAAFFGHVMPVWLKFKGGKGVATALGVLVVLLPWAALAGFVVWMTLLIVFRVSSIGSLCGAVVAVVVGFVVHRPIEYPAVAVVFLLLMLITHRSNLKRLINRNENSI